MRRVQATHKRLASRLLVRLLIRLAKSVAATNTAERAPKYACQLLIMLFSMSMPAGLVSKAEPTLYQLPDH